MLLVCSWRRKVHMPRQTICFPLGETQRRGSQDITWNYRFIGEVPRARPSRDWREVIAVRPC